MTEPVVRVRAGTTEDRYGNTTPNWSAASRSTIEGCAVAYRKAGDTGEDRDNGRQGVIIGLTVYAPPGADVVASDRLEVRGDAYDVEGEPGTWVNPYTSIERGVEIALRRVTG